MASFNVLILDDHDAVHERAKQELESDEFPGLRLISARTLEQAKRIATERLIHLHFVDLMIGRQQLGTQYIRHVATMNPRSEFVIISAWRREKANEVIELLGSGAQVVGFSNKLEVGSGEMPQFLPYVEPRYSAWASRSVSCNGLSEVVEALMSKRERINQELGDATKLPSHRLSEVKEYVIEEVEYLVRRIFSIATPIAGRPPVIDLKVLRKGFSSSVVVEATPRLPIEGLDRLVPGNRCVLKFSSARGTQLEIERYDHVVRFGVSLEFRVEMLGSAVGNSLGAVCYSFAGATGGGVLQSLDEVLLKGGKEWRIVLQDIFEPDTSNWYDVKGSARSLDRFFREEYGGSLVRSIDALETWLNSLRDELNELDLRDLDRAGVEVREAWVLRLGGERQLRLPKAQFLTTRYLREPTKGCLVHGDLHAGNILISHADGRLKFRIIDYGNAGLGPRLIDLAALASSIRLAHADRAFGGDMGISAENLQSIFDASYGQEVGLLTVGNPDDADWIAAVKALEGRINHIFEGVTTEEWIWTLFAQCLSMFRFDEIPWHKKFRLVIWLSALTEVLYPLLLKELGAANESS